MAISMDNLPAAENRVEVTSDMVTQWCEAYEAEQLPEGYAFVGSIKPGRPRLANEATSSLSFKCPESGADMIAQAAKVSGVKKSAFIREASLEKAAKILTAAG